MAQRSRSLGTRVRLLAKRYGLADKGGVAAACLVLVVVLLVVGLARADADGGMQIERSEDAVTEAMPEETDGATVEVVVEEAPAVAVVHVDGAVASPGVYEVSAEGARINDVVERAGGLAPDANTEAVNLAAPVSDGQKVHIPRLGEEAPVTPAGAEVVPPSTTAPDPSASSNLVNVNTASREELMTLSGVGEATADAIIEEREANGPFASPDDLVRVSGIGEKKLAKMRGAVCV